MFYTGAAPNQQAIPAVEYLMSKEGGGAKRFFLLGTDYVYPRTTNKILRTFLHSKGVTDEDIMEKYTPFGHSDYQTIVANIKKFAAGGKTTAVISTINGDSNVPFYKELGNQGLKATDVPVVAFSVGEEELRGIDTKPLVGHLAAWNYFMSMKNPTNKAFIKKWTAYAKTKNLPGGDKRVTNDPMEATYIGIHMWAQAVEKAKSTDVDKVIAGDGRPDLHGARRASHRRWTRRTTTCTSRCSSARSRPTASSTSCGRRRARSARSRGARTSRATRARRTSPSRVHSGRAQLRRQPNVILSAATVCARQRAVGSSLLAHGHDSPSCLRLSALAALVLARCRRRRLALTAERRWRIAAGDNDSRIAALNARGRARRRARSAALRAGAARRRGRRSPATTVFIVHDGKRDATRRPALPPRLPDGAEDVVDNNRMRRDARRRARRPAAALARRRRAPRRASTRSRKAPLDESIAAADREGARGTRPIPG